MNDFTPTAFTPEWPEPAPRFLREEIPLPPELPLVEVFGQKWAKWITQAAEAKSSPPDYVVAGLLATAGAAIGNSRWASPWQGWAEPPILWTMAIGSPSSNKSPGLDAVLSPLKQAESAMRKEAEAALMTWREGAKIAESEWKGKVKDALKDGKEPPAKPKAANPGQEPFLPRLSVADVTVERLAVIADKQPRGTLLARDELAGWLHGMTRYSGGGSDRPFWLEAYGGRGYTVERMSRDPVTIERLSIGVVGGIQPDRLKSLLIQSDDDGLLARLLPVWPNPAPIKRPGEFGEDGFFEGALAKLLSLQMIPEETEPARPYLIQFSDEARDLLDVFRISVRDLETGAEGLLLSFIGKTPGFAVRLSLVLAYLDWAAGPEVEPHDITAEHFNRAAYFVETYALPMARRAYADGSVSKPERAARKLIAIIREQKWKSFTSRKVLRLDRAGLATSLDMNPALAVLEEANVIRKIEEAGSPQGGRPTRHFAVNPAMLEQVT